MNNRPRSGIFCKFEDLKIVLFVTQKQRSVTPPPRTMNPPPLGGPPPEKKNWATPPQKAKSKIGDPPPEKWGGGETMDKWQCFLPMH